MSHTVGGNIASQLDWYNVAWYRYGEDIGWSTASFPTNSARAIYQAWMGSSPHRALLLSTNLNYIGVGLAYRSSNHRTYGSAVFAESPDHTRPVARVTGSSRSGDDVRWTWNGYDPRLQTHTAGFRDYDVQYRVGSGTWSLIREQHDVRVDRCSRTARTVATTRSACGPPTDVAMWAHGAARNASGSPDPSMRRHPFAAVNLISDPIHGYIELTKRLAPPESAAAGLPDEEVAEEDLLDTAWLQRLRRISQLQSARWVFPTAEHSRFTHGLGVMHEAGLWARSLYPSLASALAPSPTAARSRPRAWSPRPCGWPACSTTSGTGRSPTSSTTTSSRRSRRRPTRAGRRQAAHPRGPERPDHRASSAPLLRGLRRAPGAVAERDALRDDEAIDPAWVAFLIAKPALSDPDDAALGPLARAAAVGRVHGRQPRLRAARRLPDRGRRPGRSMSSGCGGTRSSAADGLTLFEPGLGALEMFLTARRFMYQQVYFHRTVRAIDLDLAEVFGPSIRAIFGDGSPADRLAAYADLDEYALLHQAARWARGAGRRGRRRRRAEPGDGRVPAPIAEAWRAILLRQPTLALRGGGPRRVRGAASGPRR